MAYVFLCVGVYICRCVFHNMYALRPHANPTHTSNTNNTKQNQAFRWWLGGLGFFFGLLGLVSLTSPGDYNPVVRGDFLHTIIYVCVYVGLKEKISESTRALSKHPPNIKPPNMQPRRTPPNINTNIKTIPPSPQPSSLSPSSHPHRYKTHQHPHRHNKTQQKHQVNKAETMPDLGLAFIKTGGSPAAEEEEEASEE